MALIQQPTLGEITGDVLAAVGQGGTGVASAATREMAQTLIRRAQKIVQEEAPWTISFNSLDIALPAGQTQVEFPDNSDAGNIHLMYAKRASNPQFIWQLDEGITPDDRSVWINAANQSALTYSPRRYMYINGMIEVGPACTENITLTVQYTVGAAVMEEDGDRPNCDGFAVGLLAEIYLRNHQGGDFRQAIPELRVNYQNHLDKIKNKQLVRETVVPGSDWDFYDPARRHWWNNTRQRPWWLRDVRP